MKRNSYLLLLIFLFITGCQKDPVVGEKEENLLGEIHLTGKEDYKPEVSSYILQDDEPESILFNEAERSFKVTQPIQVSINEKQELFIRSYSPRDVRGFTVWAKIPSAYEEEFRLATFDVLPAFIEFHQLLPFRDADRTYTTRSGKRIMLLANPRISAADITLEVECNDPYYEKLQKIQTKWKVWFSDYGKTGAWQWPLLPAHARECVAISLNMSYMFSTDYFRQELEKYRGKLFRNDNKTGEVNIDDLYKTIMNHSGLRWGHVTGYGGLGGGNTIGIHDGSYLNHYVDDSYEVMALFHEFGHCVGGGHTGNMTNENAGPGLRILLRDCYKEMSIRKELPIYSRRFMHNREKGRFYGVDRYVRSTYVIDDPELDAIDGGLTYKLPEDDFEEKGTPLTASISYKDIPGATAETFSPKDVCAEADRIYILNNAAKHYSIEVFEEKEGKLQHIRSISSWQFNGNGQTFAGEPNGITVRHGKLYVTSTESRTFIFDTATLQYSTCIGTGSWGDGGAQTVHAFDAMVRRGMVFIRDKRKVCIYKEEDVTPQNYPTICRYSQTSNLGEAMGTYGLAMDKGGMLYTTHYGNKAIYGFDITALQASSTVSPTVTLKLQANVYDIAIFNGRMFATLNQKQRLVELNPKDGSILKDYTQTGGADFSGAEKFSVSRSTLFVANPKTKTVTAIPVPEN